MGFSSLVPFTAQISNTCVSNMSLIEASNQCMQGNYQIEGSRLVVTKKNNRSEISVKEDVGGGLYKLFARAVSAAVHVGSTALSIVLFPIKVPINVIDFIFEKAINSISVKATNPCESIASNLSIGDLQNKLLYTQSRINFLTTEINTVQEQLKNLMEEAKTIPCYVAISARTYIDSNNGTPSPQVIGWLNKMIPLYDKFQNIYNAKIWYSRQSNCILSQMASLITTLKVQQNSFANNSPLKPWAEFKKQLPSVSYNFNYLEAELSFICAELSKGLGQSYSSNCGNPAPGSVTLTL